MTHEVTPNHHTLHFSTMMDEVNYDAVTNTSVAYTVFFFLCFLLLVTANLLLILIFIR